MYLNKKLIFIYIGIIAFLVLLTYFLSKNNEQGTSLNDKGTSQSGVVQMSQNTSSGNYFEGSATVVSTPLPENFQQKLQQEGRIKKMTLTFNKDGFGKTQTYSFQLQTNIQLELDASNTGLPDGTVLNFSIPGAALHAQISVPGRYKYSLYFKENGDQDIVLEGAGLSDGKIVKSISIK